MAKKPAKPEDQGPPVGATNENPNPTPADLVPVETLGEVVTRFDKDFGAASVSIPGVDESSESLIAVVARQHARIVSLEARVDALAEAHRQTYGKVI